MNNEFQKKDETITVKGKNGKIVNNISLRGKKGITPPRGFALLSPKKNKVVDSSSAYTTLEAVEDKARRAIWANLIANSTCETVADIGAYKILDSNTLVKLTKDTDMIQEPSEPIFTDSRRDAVNAFFKTKIEKVVQTQDGSKELFYSVPGFQNKDGLRFAFRQAGDINGDSGDIALVLLDSSGDVVEVLKGNKQGQVVNEYVGNYSSVTSLTRGELTLEYFSFHVDHGSGEISLLEIKSSTDWFPSDLANEG